MSLGGKDEPDGDMDESAATFESLALPCRPRIYRAACLLLDGPDEAQDVTQCVFAQAWRGWSRFEGRSDVFTWLYRILLRVCARQRWRRGLLALRFGSREPIEVAGTVADPTPGPDAAAVQADNRAEIRRLLRGLSPKLRAVLVLRFVEDQTVPEIACSLGIPEGTVKSRLNYAVHAAAQVWRERNTP
jgi:RNA polymerase sigma-70 factor (ECF subfamily)